MKNQALELAKSRELVLTGVLGIVQGESPSMIEKRLRLFLSGNEAEGDNKDGDMAKAA
jgi:flagellar motor component MotA